MPEKADRLRGRATHAPPDSRSPPSQTRDVTDLKSAPHGPPSPPPEPDPRPDGGAEASVEVTRLLDSMSRGNADALDRLMPIIYEDLRALARRRIASEQDGHTLNTTAMVHEAYVRLVEGRDRGWKNRVHFFAAASRVMRHILIDYARMRQAEKRGGGAVPIPLDQASPGRDTNVVDVLEINDALEKLALHDPRLERVVEYRFFGGMSMEETAEALGVSVRTATRDWRRARAYLYDALRP